MGAFTALAILPLCAVALTVGAVVYFKRKIQNMSAEYDQLKSHVETLITESKAKDAQIATLTSANHDLQNQLTAAQAAAGTPDAALAALDAEVVPELQTLPADPAAAATGTPSTPETAPAAT